MSSSREPNPLRPYYVPPNVGSTVEQTPLHNASSHHSSPQTSFGVSARDLLSDLDYGDYISDGSPTAAEVAKRLIDRAAWGYTTVLLAQPFEVAKTILQCYSPGQAADAPSANLQTPRSLVTEEYEDYRSDDSDSDNPSYFTSRQPQSASQRTSSRRTRRSPRPQFESSSPVPKPSAATDDGTLDLRREALLEVVGQLWAKEGAFGIWKGTNATFVHNFLLKAIENWVRSFLAALFNVPDPGIMRGAGASFGGLDIVDSPNPVTSVGVIIAAAGVAAVILSPLDLVRTRLIITSASSPPRTLLPSLRQLSPVRVASRLMPITIVQSGVTRLISATAPLFVRNTLRVDPFLAPASYSICAFLASTVELFVKLPLETVLRRAQVGVLSDLRPSSRAIQTNSFEPIINVGAYKGVVGTLWYIVREEGTSHSSQQVYYHSQAGQNQKNHVASRRGQGLGGLWRGWRVGFWGLVGVWGAANFAGATSRGEF